MTVNCEFCAELSGAQNRFQSLYPSVSDRIVLEDSKFFVIPSIAPLGPRHLLVLPKCHVERFSDLADQYLDEFDTISKKVIESFFIGRNFIMMEHGVAKGVGLSCGVNHAHFHFVEVSKSFNLRSLGSISDERAIDFLKGSASVTLAYLLASDGSRTALSTWNGCGEAPLELRSQYSRAQIAKNLGRPDLEDWRNAKADDPALMTMLVEMK